MFPTRVLRMQPSRPAFSPAPVCLLFCATLSSRSVHANPRLQKEAHSGMPPPQRSRDSYGAIDAFNPSKYFP